MVHFLTYSVLQCHMSYSSVQETLHITAYSPQLLFTSTCKYKYMYTYHVIQEPSMTCGSPSTVLYLITYSTNLFKSP